MTSVRKQQTSTPVAAATGTQKRIRSRWTKDEDERLIALMQPHENDFEVKCSWKRIAEHFEGRTAKQCNDHWHALTSKAKKQKWTRKEDIQLLTLVNASGKKWRLVAQRMLNRTRIQVKNRYYHLK